MIKIKEIKTVISKCTGIKLIELNGDSSAADFPKWDSLAHLKIMLAFEKMNNKKINTTKMSELNSIKKIFDYLD